MAPNQSTAEVDRQLLELLVAETRPVTAEGTVADYIPALASVDRDQLGVAVWTAGTGVHTAGDADVAFSIQSVSKVFTLTLALRLGIGGALWDRVGREPSGDPFNSIVLLERERGVPRNPFINAGAIVVADVLAEHLASPVDSLVDLVGRLVGEPVSIDRSVAASEAATGDRNRSLAHLMRDFGNLRHPVEEVLDVYFHQCALALSARQVVLATRFLANDGIDPATGTEILSPTDARRVNALMLMAGTYDAAGAFAFEIGIPCKSGVGGGIVGIVPDRATVCTWSPALDPTGNSYAGRALLRALVSRSGLSVF